MSAGLRATRASTHLDMIRGVAAVVVLIYHVRYRFFFDFADLPSTTPLASAWYALTAFGHDAVMVFFVVSGLLVGGAAVREHRANRWSWESYLTARCVRLYVVLLPGLLLTAFWDRLGMYLFPSHPVYTGAPRTYLHDFFSVADRSGLETLAGNAGFVQGIVVPTFGSNAALWSLSFEFWYYIAFPLLAVAVLARGRKAIGILSAVAGLGVLYFAGADITLYFSIWLFGVVVGVLPPAGWVVRSPRLASLISGGLFAVWAFGSHLGVVRRALDGSLFAVDVITGALFAIWLYVLLHDRRDSAPGWYQTTARLLADMSYTLYVAHLPLLVFLRAWLVPDIPWSPDALSIAVGCAIAGVALVYSWGIAVLTEHKTAAVRRAVDRWLAAPALRRP